ncbi:glycosyltransferase family 2 protein [Thalassotalea euphylliae]|uniref:glycosyltransferase family 2 protein n=1 Tax=Thalassotalea euphylliae TaxID=1655234 RepID=UPI0015F25D8D|nr:glycosyltransferase family A protein [Thalassotalea euphylliae]
MTSFISIIVPIYNVEEYLDDCLSSIANQTDLNFEALLINDGSTDKSGLIAEKYCQKYPELFSYHYKTNGGLSDARNFGIQKAQGEYLMFLDSDDYLASNTLQKVNQVIKDSTIDVLCFGMVEVDELGHKLRDIPPCSDGKQGTIQKSENSYLYSKMLPNACNKLIKSSLFSDHNIAFPKGLWYEDLATIPKIVYEANQVEVINSGLYFYRNRDGAITKTFSLKVMDIYEVLEDLDNYFKHSRNIGKKEVWTEISSWYINLTNITLARLVRNNDPQKPAALAKISRIIKQRFSNPLEILFSTTSKPHYKLFALLVRLGLIQLVSRAFTYLVNKGKIKI